MAVDLRLIQLIDLPSCTFSRVTAMDCIHHGVSAIKGSKAVTIKQHRTVFN